MIKRTDASLVFERAIDLGADFAELFIEDRRELHINYNRKVDGVTGVRVYGAGLYLMLGTKAVYVYGNDTGFNALMGLCEKGCGLLLAEGGMRGADVPDFAAVSVDEPNPVVVHPSSVGHADKIKLLQNIDSAVFSGGGDVLALPLTYFDTEQNVAVINSEGVWAEDRRITSRIRWIPVVTHNGDTSSDFSDFTRPMGFEAFKSGEYIDAALGAVNDMRSALRADEAPGGYMPVVFDEGACTGTFFHEACGHQFETGAIIKGGIFKDRIGEKVASEKVTLIDDGTFPHAYGSSKFDDEGMPRQKNVLIENGVMRSYLSDRLGSRILGVPRTASGRRQGYAYAPAPRMSNTYLAAGHDDPDEMLRSMAEGLFVTKIGGGSGGREFTLAAQIAFLVKNGKIDRQVKGATIMGRGDETMLKIDRVGNTNKKRDGGAFCGSVSGLCNTTAFGARIRVEGMLVGGKGG
jgi:TldD protein